MAQERTPTKKQTFYQTLQVEANDRTEIIDLSFRRLAKKYHPDYNSSDSAMSKMQDLNGAYSVLRNRDKRRNYDFELENQDMGSTSRINDRTRNTAFIICLVILTGLLFQFFNPPTRTVAISKEEATTNRAQTASRLPHSNEILLSTKSESAQINNFEVALPATVLLSGNLLSSNLLSSNLLPSNIESNTALSSLSASSISATSRLLPSKPKIVTVGEVLERNQDIAKSQVDNNQVDNNIALATTNLPSVTTDPAENTGSINNSTNNSTIIDNDDSTDSKQSVGEATSVDSTDSTNTSDGEKPATRQRLSLVPVTSRTTNSALTTIQAPQPAPTSIPVPVVVPTTTLGQNPPAVALPTGPQTIVQTDSSAQPLTVQQADMQSLPSVNPTGSIRLLNPVDGINGRKRQTFEWSADFAPSPTQGFELIFWQPGKDPLRQGFGLAPPTSNTSLTVNLDKLDITLGSLLDWGHYEWGILLVEREPYERIALLGTNGQPETRGFLFTNYKSPARQAQR